MPALVVFAIWAMIVVPTSVAWLYVADIMTIPA
jgi:hypothetical protein